MLKIERTKEIQTEAEKNNSNINKPNKNQSTLPSDTIKEKRNKQLGNNNTKHVSMMEGRKRYNITDDLNKLMANISISQLIDASPKLRSELSKALKLKAPEMTEENPEKVMMSALSREDVATAECIVENTPGVAFLDTCASIN